MLNRKMFRDIKNNLSQFVTIFLMITIGVMVYTTMLSYSGAMQISGDNYYEKNNLFDLEAFGENFTKEDLTEIKKINNVKDAERKLYVKGVNGDDTLEINFIESNNITKFYVFDGEEFDVNKSGVWVDNDYAINNDIKVGDYIQVKYESMNLNEKVLGLINTPDHIYTLKDSSALMPDRVTFGYVYLSINEIPEDFIKAMVMKEANISEADFDKLMPDFNYKDHYFFNELMIDLDDVDEKVVNKSINDIEDNIKNALVITKREDNTSVTFYQGEINEGQDYVGIFSGLFIFIAILSVITTMTRVVKKQRVQIGTLKALGFSNYKILMHYIGYGFWITLAGIIAGILLGNYGFTRIVIALQMSYFEVPEVVSYIDPRTYVMAVSLLVIVSVITLITGKGILKKSAAETLRNEIPQVNSATLNITRKGALKKLSFATKWNIRDILRNKMRTIMGVVGITGCSLLIVVSMGMIDSFDDFIDMQFTKLYNFDYKLTLTDNITESEYNDLVKKYGDKTSASKGIELKIDDERITTSANIIDSGNYIRFINEDDDFITLDSNEGVYVTRLLAEKNNLKVGDKVVWHIFGSDKYYESTIIGLNKDPQLQNMTMTREYYESLGLTYKPNYLYTNENLHGVSDIAGVEFIQGKEDLRENLGNMMAMVTDLIVMIVFLALVLGAVIIYNMGVLSYGEKEYQFATLKVLGFNDKQIKKIFIKQNIWIAVLSAILGMPSGYLITDYVFKMVADRDYDFGAVITLKTYIISFAVTVICSYLVSLFIARKIKNIDMVSSLKGNE